MPNITDYNEIKIGQPREKVKEEVKEEIKEKINEKQREYGSKKVKCDICEKEIRRDNL